MNALIIHGLHVDANGWENLIWGKLDENTWGTIPRGVEAAFRLNSSLIVWGSGASEKDGKKEAELMYERAMQGIDELAKICNTNPETLKNFLSERSVIDTKSKDTKEEVLNTLELCLQKNINEIILVPYGSQAPIAIRRILFAVLENDKYKDFKHHISILPSDTRYVGVSMDEIVIFTPPHRGDRLKNPSHIYARKTLDVIQKMSKTKDSEGLEKFLNEWNELLEKHLK